MGAMVRSISLEGRSRARTYGNQTPRTLKRCLGASFVSGSDECVCVYVCMVAVSTSSAIMHHESNREMLASGGVGVAEIEIGRRII